MNERPAEMTSYYKPFNMKGQGWFFMMPEQDGPPENKGYGPMLVGPYVLEADAWVQILKLGKAKP